MNGLGLSDHIQIYILSACWDCRATQGVRGKGKREKEKKQGRSLSRKQTESLDSWMAVLGPSALLTRYGRWCCDRPIKVNPLLLWSSVSQVLSQGQYNLKIIEEVLDKRWYPRKG
jgi:hypothetical protein